MEIFKCKYCKGFSLESKSFQITLHTSFDKLVILRIPRYSLYILRDNAGFLVRILKHK